MKASSQALVLGLVASKVKGYLLMAVETVQRMMHLPTPIVRRKLWLMDFKCAAFLIGRICGIIKRLNLRKLRVPKVSSRTTTMLSTPAVITRALMSVPTPKMTKTVQTLVKTPMEPITCLELQNVNTTSTCARIMPIVSIMPTTIPTLSTPTTIIKSPARVPKII